jgi:Holliday junction resolvase
MPPEGRAPPAERRTEVAIEFYDVKSREKVSIPEDQIKKTVYHPKGSGGKPRYALRAEHNGTNLTKFVNKDTYDSMNVPEA